MVIKRRWGGGLASWQREPRQREPCIQRHGKSTTDCLMGCKGRSQECQKLALERESGAKSQRTLKAMPKKLNLT